jgi:hypothetical protein
VSDDGTELLLARRANGKGAFRLTIDEALVAQLEIASARFSSKPVEEAPPESPALPQYVRPVSKLTIKEIQILLRQGQSIAAVAKKAGVDAGWVERFEPPIAWERAGMAARARRERLFRARMGQSAADLGDSVERNLKKRGVTMAPEDLVDAWDSVKRTRGDRWVVSFQFEQRGRRRRAEWEFDPTTSKLRALDALSAELGWIARRSRRTRNA